MIQIGKITNNSAAAGNFLMTIGVTLYETYYESTGNLKKLNDAVAAAASDSEVGKDVGLVISEIFQWTVPTFKVNEFGVGE